MFLRSILLGLVATVSTIAVAVLEKAYIIQLDSGTDTLSTRSLDQHEIFHKRATSLDYIVRHEFKNSEVYLGLSIQVSSTAGDAEIKSQIRSIPGVIAVSSVYDVTIGSLPNSTALDPFQAFANPPSLAAVTGTGNLGSALQMGGVDKLHNLGIKGSGIKIGVVDTGVDYRHPALGAGFGPGHKIAGGYSFVSDNGTLVNSSDPLVTCYGGGHGTHVSGILAMDPVAGSFNITGVAPASTLYMYRAFDCTGHGGSDSILAAMSKAQSDGVNLVSMSLGIGTEPFDGEVDPVAAVTKTLTDAGIAVIVANANDAIGSMYGAELYSEEWPSTEPTAIGVGAISNTDFPLVYPAVDSAGATLQYASVYPLNFPNGADVLILDDGCDSDDWNTALAAITNINETIIAFQVDADCRSTSAGSWSSSTVRPVYIAAYNANSSDPYLSAYDTPSQGFFGTTEFINLNAADGLTLATNYAAAGGYTKYKLKFNSSSFISVPQPSGGMMDYYSSFGPVWHTYDMKPQIAAPGGHVLSTWPLGILGGYCILSGTSMATPYLAASYALVKSQFPTATIEQIKDKLQTNAIPVPWVYNTAILSATAQQGAGLVNTYNAIFSKSTITPGQLLISDVSKTVYGTASITISNPSSKSVVYTLSHQGAGYMDYYLTYMEISQQANYGSAKFSTSTVTVGAGKSTTVSVTVSPPSNVTPSQLPVFGGFIKVSDSAGESFSVPYLGPPYSLYNTPYLYVSTSGTILPEIYAFAADGTTSVDTGLMNFTEGLGYGSAVPTIQWSTAARVDLLPANTTIKPSHYGYNISVTYPYIPSEFTPNSTVFGYPSFGVLLNETGYLWPGNYAPNSQYSTVTSSNGVSYLAGPGDYRLFASVLRWGGKFGNQADYDTWLGPVVRWVSA